MIPFKYRMCSQCQVYKIITEFRYSIKNGYNCYSQKCKKCINENNRNNIERKEKIKIYKSTKEYKQKSSEYYKLYSSTKKFKEHRSKRRKEIKINNKVSPIEKLKKNVSSSVLKSLKIRDVSKNNKSIWKFLPYTPEQLKNHLESLFEPWMNWNNHGVYNPKDHDTNPTWQLDHIIPHSTFNYTSMDSEEFQKCWNLNNLRPLNSKENVMDGAKKIRH